VGIAYPLRTKDINERNTKVDEVHDGVHDIHSEDEERLVAVKKALQEQKDLRELFLVTEIPNSFLQVVKDLDSTELWAVRSTSQLTKSR
jgi:hypothetical protein